MVGGGQLSRMTQQAAIALGQSLRVLAVSPSDPAALVTPNVTIGHHTDLDALRGFAAEVDVLTFDHEHVPTEHLRTLVAEGFTVHPGPEALIHAQDKLVMRNRLADMDVPIPAYAEVKTPADVTAFGEKHGWPVVLKAARGGYDGRGVWMVPSSGEALVTELLEAGTPLLVEERVDMTRELAAVVARSPFGQGAAWPTVQTVQSNGICVEVLAPAPSLSPDLAEEAQELALRIASSLGVVGVLAVELFETASGLVVNELAMRPHNSGHWTIEGAGTSQFEQHLRAVLDYPLGSTDPVAPVVVMANVLGARSTPDMGADERLHHLFARYKDVHVHYYGKAERPGRKIGHVTVLGTNLAEVRQRARFAADWLSAAAWPDGYDVHGGK
ncbi:5-(carboxyamino)imidazole ribonucleotide synthase [Kibdelosporangium persicum]